MMFGGGNRKVNPQQRQEQEHRYINVYFDRETSSSSSDNESLSSFAYALRKVWKSDISRLCDNHEIDFIEKRFEDTSRVIFKDLEYRNRILIQRSLKRPVRSDIVAVGGMRLTSAKSENFQKNAKDRNSSQRKDLERPLPTIENIWQEPNEPQPAKSTSNRDNENRIGKNSVHPGVIQAANGGGARRKGMCRVT